MAHGLRTVTAAAVITIVATGGAAATSAERAAPATVQPPHLTISPTSGTPGHRGGHVAEDRRLRSRPRVSAG